MKKLLTSNVEGYEVLVGYISYPSFFMFAALSIYQFFNTQNMDFIQIMKAYVP